MSDAAFTHDVFLSHSAKDKAVVRAVAERLRKDGLRVWFDEWEFPSPAGAGEGARRAGAGRGAESIPAKIEEGLEHSRVLVLCMSANAFGSDPGAPGFEAGTCGRSNLPFRDPLNKERRFIPLRLGSGESELGELGCPRTRRCVRRETGSARGCHADTILNWPRPPAIT